MKPKKKNSTIKLLGADILLVSFFAFFLFYALSFYYRQGGLILGGEGNYVLDYALHLKKFSFLWFPVYGFGIPNISSSGTGFNIFLLHFLELLPNGVALANFALVFLIYFLPFCFMYFASRAASLSPLSSFLAAAFYVLNPFSSYYLTCLNQWNVFVLALMPLFFWIILKNHGNSFRTAFFLGLASLCFSFTFTNPPLGLIVLISAFISLLIAGLLCGAPWQPGRIILTYGCFLLFFVLLNSWWILGFLVCGASSVSKYYTIASATAWLKTTVQGHGAILAKTLSFATMIPENPHYDFYNMFFRSPLARFVTLIPTVLVFGLSLYAHDKKSKKTYLIIFCGLMVILFLLKGSSGFLGFLYSILFTYFPGFYVFKTPVEKFGILYVFVFTILLAAILKNTEQKEKLTFVRRLLAFYLLFCSVPLLSGHMVPDYNIGPLGFGSRKYQETAEGYDIRKKIIEDPTQHRILSMPGVGNYQVCLKMREKAYYTGIDPILMNTDKPFLATQDQVDVLYTSAGLPRYARLLGLLNIKKILINKALAPWFGVIGIGDTNELGKIFTNAGLASDEKKEARLYLFKNNPAFVRPLIYATGSET